MPASTVRLSGWVHRKRDHGNLLFIDLRDHYGITQCVDRHLEPAVHGGRGGPRSESVVTVTGKVVRAPARDGQPQAADRRGRAADRGLHAAVDRRAAAAPGHQRRGCRRGDAPAATASSICAARSIHRNIVLRSQVIASIRRRMIEQGFTEFQTPILTSSSPEGARDFLVPSRLHPGKFYALPQAPQQFKQLLMVAGLRPLFPDRALLPRRGQPRRPLAGRVLSARFRDALRDPGGRVRRDRAGAARRVRGVRRRPQGDAGAVPAHRLSTRRC